MTALGRNGRTALVLSGVVAGMVGLSFASVPLYKLFCQVTGYGGTTQRAEQGADRVIERMMTVRFNADTARDMPWIFRPSQRQIDVKVGENHLAYYRAENRTSQTITGTATFNVTPAKAGLYFSKIDCFCFTEQVLKPGESAELPVSFFVDPAINEDRNLDEVKTITLSYTFFRAPTPEPARTSALTKDFKIN
ncbi:MAG: cytochrome c oxidase assembly protein [Alphaproteobacteria bacterium]|nr:cytochrome c oxidase assembly protein [Alphaproteobacteria bacterium]